MKEVTLNARVLSNAERMATVANDGITILTFDFMMFTTGSCEALLHSIEDNDTVHSPLTSDVV